MVLVIGRNGEDDGWDCGRILQVVRYGSMYSFLKETYQLRKGIGTETPGKPAADPFRVPIENQQIKGSF